MMGNKAGSIMEKFIKGEGKKIPRLMNMTIWACLESLSSLIFSPVLVLCLLVYVWSCFSVIRVSEVNLEFWLSGVNL